MMRRLACLWMLLLGVPVAVSAAATESADQTKVIELLMARIEKLEKRVADLERSPREGVHPSTTEAGGAEGLNSDPPGGEMPRSSRGTPRPSRDMPAQSAQQHSAQVPLAETQPQYPSLHLAGFSDFNFSATDQSGAKSGFNEGQFVLHLASALSPKVSFFGETSFTARTDAGSGTPRVTGFDTEIERSIIRFDHSDRLKVSFGRYHTPINWWNTAFHHGQWLQTSISRPEMARFGGQFIPIHFVGGLVEGALPAGGLNVNYNFGVGNGRGSVISRGGDAGDNDNNRAWMINLFAKPDRFFGLQAGGSVYRDKVTPSGGSRFDEWIASGHIVWEKEDPELIAEFANVNHREANREISFNSQAFYVQMGYRLPWFQKLWKPYYRFEYIHIPRAEPVFQALPGLEGSILGMRYDISSFAAIKFEYRNQRRSGQGRVNGAFLQTSFRF